MNELEPDLMPNFLCIIERRFHSRGGGEPPQCPEAKRGGTKAIHDNVARWAKSNSVMFPIGIYGFISFRNHLNPASSTASFDKPFR